MMPLIHDKSGLLAQPPTSPLNIELGCGASKRDPLAIGIDVVDYEGVDVVGDACDVLAKLPENSVQRVTAVHFLEHVTEVEVLLAAVDRVLVPGGVVHVFVPHFSNPYFYSDPTHVRPFGLYTFSYWCDNPLLKRQVPRYHFRLPWRVQSMRLRFNSDPSFPGRQFARKVAGRVMRRSYKLMELYEDLFCWVFPCYEIEILIVKA